MADMKDESNEYIDNGSSNLVNALAKEQADEIRNKSESSFESENNAIQQNTAVLNRNTQAQKKNNDAKKESAYVDDMIGEAEKNL